MHSMTNVCPERLYFIIQIVTLYVIVCVCVCNTLPAFYICPIELKILLSSTVQISYFLVLVYVVKMFYITLKNIQSANLYGGRFSL